MAKEFKLKIVIDAVTKAAQGELDGVAGKLQTLGNVAVGLGGAAVVGIGTLGAGMVKLAVDAAPLEGVEKAFEGLTESSGQSADAMLAALQEGSAGMITQADLMTSYNQAAQLVGTTFANTLPEAMGYLSKVSAATGEDMGFMLDSLVRGVGRLSPLILDNLGIQVDLVEANEAYAASVGKSASELTKGEQQAALMAQVMEKLAENTAAMPEVAGSAAQKVASLGVQFEDFKDMAGKALLPALSEVAGMLLDLAERVMPLVIDFIQGTVAPAVEGLVNTFGALFDAAMQGSLDLSTLEGVLRSLLPESVVDAVMGLVNGLRDLYDAVAPIVSQAAAWVSQFVSWEDVLIAVGVCIAAVVIPALVSIVSAVAPVVAAAVGLIAIIALVRSAWENDWGGIQTKVMEVLDVLIPFIISAGETIQAFWEEHGENILAILSNVWDSISTVISTTINVIMGIIKLVLDLIAGDWEGAWQDVLSIAENIWNLLTTLFENALDNILRLFGSSLEDLKAAATEKLNAVVTLVSDTVDTIVSLFDIDLYSIGQNIINSLKAGIESKVQEILSAIQDIINSIIREAQEALSAFSASRVFVEIGQTIPAGLAEGISALADLPVAATGGMISGVIGTGGGKGGTVVLAPVFLDPREFETAEGLDYEAIGARLMQLQGVM